MARKAPNMKRMAVLAGLLVVECMVACVVSGLLVLFPASDEQGDASRGAAHVAGLHVRHHVERDARSTRVAASSERLVPDRQLLGDAVELAPLRLDGDPVGLRMAMDIASAHDDYPSRIEYINQRGFMPAGCEIVSLTVALRSLGYTADADEIATRYLAGTGYIGSPYANGGGLPPQHLGGRNALARRSRRWRKRA